METRCYCGDETEGCFRRIGVCGVRIGVMGDESAEQMTSSERSHAPGRKSRHFRMII